MTLGPPTEVEKRSLAIFTGMPMVQERFTRLVMPKRVTLCALDDVLYTSFDSNRN